MPFDAGSISRQLKLDISQYLDAVRQAVSAGAAFPRMSEDIGAAFRNMQDASGATGQSVKSDFADIGESIGASAASATDDLGNVGSALKDAAQDGSAFASEMEASMYRVEAVMSLMPHWVTDFIASPWLGAADIVKEAVEGMIDTISNVGDTEADTFLSAMRAGVPTEYMSEWVEVAKTVKISQQELTMGWELMSQRAAQAVDGDQKAIQGFRELGISADFLKKNLNDMPKMWDAVMQGFEHLQQTDPGKISEVSEEVFSRPGRMLIPLFRLTQDEIDKTISRAKELGAVIDDVAGKAALNELKEQVATGEAKFGAQQQLGDRAMKGAPNDPPFTSIIQQGWQDFYTSLGDISTLIYETLTGQADTVSQQYSPAATRPSGWNPATRPSMGPTTRPISEGSVSEAFGDDGHSHGGKFHEFGDLNLFSGSPIWRASAATQPSGASASSGASGGSTTVNNNYTITVNANNAQSAEDARKVALEMQREIKRLEHQGHEDRTRHALGGRPSSRP